MLKYVMIHANRINEFNDLLSIHKHYMVITDVSIEPL